MLSTIGHPMRVFLGWLAWAVVFAFSMPLWVGGAGLFVMAMGLCVLFAIFSPTTQLLLERRVAFKGKPALAVASAFMASLVVILSVAAFGAFNFA